MPREVTFPCPHCRRLVRLSDTSKVQCLLLGEVAKVLKVKPQTLSMIPGWPTPIGKAPARHKLAGARTRLYLRTEVIACLASCERFGPVAAALVDQVLP